MAPNDVKFDFLSDYEIVKTHIYEAKRGKLRLSLETLQGVILYSIVLYEASRFSSPFLDLQYYTVHNSTGTYTEPFKLEYYEGRISLPDIPSHVHGTLYHGMAFEGVIQLSNRTYYLEAVDRHKTWSRDQSLFYFKDDVDKFNDGEINFSELYADSTKRNSKLKTLNDLYKKHGFQKPPSPNEHSKGKRKKREAGNDQIKYCTIHMVVDGYFVHYMANNDKQEAAKMLAQNVKNVHQTFLSQDFDGNTLPDNIGVVLVGLTFIDKVFGFNYLKGDKDSELFLRRFTENYQFPGICAALVYTFQDFGPTLGMAWVATSERPYRTGIGSPWNHGFVTTLLKGKRVTARVAQLTLVHELGHSFGSSHDPIEAGHICAPTAAQGGHYIMYPTTSDGSMPNNYEFSPCSKNVIAIIIATRSVKALHNYGAPYCGNGNVEEGEECDCGTALSCHALDQCCVPAGQDNQCLLRRDEGVVCTPATHECCTRECQVMPAANHTCGGYEDCLQESMCDGEHITCPVAAHKSNGTLCKGGTRICEKGECSHSVCSVAGLDDCLCSEITETCKVCCVNSSEPVPVCRPAVDYTWFSDSNYGLVEWLEPGSLCSDGTGYCGTDRLCVIPGFKYAGIIGLQLVGSSVNKWFDSNWYYLMVFLFLAATLAVIFKCTQGVEEKHVGDAFRVGNLSRVIHECQRQRRLLNENITNLNHAVRMYEKGQQNVTTAVARLMLMFPFTPLHYLYRMAMNSANEAGAVKKLIFLKQPMRKDCTFYKAINPQMREPLTAGKANEQFEGLLIASLKELTSLSKKQQTDLGLSIPSPTRLKKMMKDRQRKLELGVIYAFNKPP